MKRWHSKLTRSEMKQRILKGMPKAQERAERIYCRRINDPFIKDLKYCNPMPGGLDLAWGAEIPMDMSLGPFYSCLDELVKDEQVKKILMRPSYYVYYYVFGSNSI